MTTFRRALGGITATAMLMAAVSYAGKFNEVLSVGDSAPPWTGLRGVDGRMHALKDLEKSPVVVVVFLCNHCPVASGYEARFKQFVKDYGDKGVAFVGISVSRFPADGFEKMQARATERQFNFPYLHDPSQAIGRKFGATATPQVFVLDRDRRVAYMGAFDDSPASADKVQEPYVRTAVDALLAGKSIEIRETRPRGCEIEYAE